ncbi:family S53 protease [Sparassis latifolia]
MISAILRVVSLFTLTLGKHVSRMHLREKRESIPTGFTFTGSPSSDTLLDLRIALVQSNPAGLVDALYDVSTPSSQNYGKYLTKEEAAQFVSPTSETAAAVNSWLQANDITATAITPAADWLSFSIPVSKANDIFATEFSVFTHSSTGKQTIRTLEYSIPAELQRHLDIVYPGTTFPVYTNKGRISSTRSRVPKRSVSARQDCSSTITPSCLQSIYAIPATPATQSTNQLLVTGFIGQYANQADLQTFLEDFRPNMSSSTTFAIQLLDGGSDPQGGSDAGVEANLDTQYTTGIATDVPITFLSVGSNNNDGYLSGFLDVANYLLAENSPPQAMSTSYSFSEPGMPSDLANNLCNAYAQLGARGVSIMYSSGDGGVSGGQSQGCSTFIPTFPSTCPYVTSVGATSGVPETAAYFSSGGFSNYFPVPSFQQGVVDSYIAGLGSTYSGLYNASGRGFPDVSAQGVNFEIIVDGSQESVDGTSCSSPTFTSIIALLNDQLIAAGKPPFGWLNPFLYSSKGASAFNDIPSGTNPGCGTNGFSAGTGWDPITGLGTPNFAKLLTAVGL